MSSLIRPFPFCERLRLLRLFSGMSTAALSGALKCSKKELNDLETGKTVITVEEIKNLRKFFHISSDQFLDDQIPYFKISLGLNKSPVLEQKFRTGTVQSISGLYPALRVFDHLKNEKLFLETLEELNLSPLIFADPMIFVNGRFMTTLLKSPRIEFTFSNVRTFRKLKAEIVKTGPGSLGQSLSGFDLYTEQFIAAWIAKILGSNTLPKPTYALPKSGVLISSHLSPSKKPNSTLV